MKLRIGIAEAASPELVIDLPPDDTADFVTDKLTAAVAAGDESVWFLDRHGARFAVKLHQINYIELGP